MLLADTDRTAFEKYCPRVVVESVAVVDKLEEKCCTYVFIGDSLHGI